MTKRFFIAQADPIAELYTFTDAATATVAQDQILSDFGAASDRITAGLLARQGHPAWVYNFDRAAPRSDPVNVGAFHYSELAYVFGTQNTIDRPWEDTDCQLSNVMSSYWVRFAESGSPNGAELPEWPSFDEKSRQVKEFGTRVSAGPGPKAARLIETTMVARLSTTKQ
jgi:para-nitrobenzyl esterase